MEYYEDVVKKIQAEKARNLNGLKNDIIAKLDSNIVDKIHFLGDWYYIYSDSFLIHGDQEEQTLLHILMFAAFRPGPWICYNLS